MMKMSLYGYLLQDKASLDNIFHTADNRKRTNAKILNFRFCPILSNTAHNIPTVR